MIAMAIIPRHLLLLMTSTAALTASRYTVHAQSPQPYPTRPVRILVGVTAGGPQDVLSRLIGQWLTERLGQPFVVDNRSGAGGNIATEAVVRSPPDGYTLLSLAPSSAINATLYPNLKFNLIRDIAPVASFVNQAQVLVVHPEVPARTIPELITHAKANPRALNFASSGVGTGPHLAGEMFKMMAGVEIAHVPYRGAGQAAADVVSGQVQLTFIAPVVALEYVRDGKLRALAVTTTTRSDKLPDVAAMAEHLRGYESTAWFGVGAPRDTPAEIVDRLNREINAGLADPRLRARLDQLGGGVVTGTPAAFARHIAEETEKWAKVVGFAGLRQERQE